MKKIQKLYHNCKEIETCKKSISQVVVNHRKFIPNSDLEKVMMIQ